MYICASLTRTLYVGSTSSLQRRIREHQSRARPGFTRRYRVDRLVYFELTPAIAAAIARERQVKGWRRQRKIDLIESMNPDWNDLSASVGCVPDGSVDGGH